MNEMTGIVYLVLGGVIVFLILLLWMQWTDNKTLRDRMRELNESLEYWRQQTNKYAEYLEDIELELRKVELEKSVEVVKLRLVATLFAARYLHAKNKCSEYFYPSFFDMSDLPKEHRSLLLEDAANAVDEALIELEKQLKEKS